MHRYMPNAGLEETRAAVADSLSTETGLTFAANHIVMTCGAGGALNVVMKTLLDPGDEFVIFAPFFVEYNFYADNHGGSCKVVPPDENFLPDMDIFRASINENTRGVLIIHQIIPLVCFMAMKHFWKCLKLSRRRKMNLVLKYIW